MFIGKIVGTVVSTQKVKQMIGWKLLIVEPYRVDTENRDKLVTTNRSLVVVDFLGCGEGDFVLVCQGSSARQTPETKPVPVDAVVIGLVNAVTVEGKVVFGS